MNPNYNHEIELEENYSYIENDNELRVLFKHDYFSSDNDLGKKYMDTFIESLILDSDKIALIIVVDSAVKLIDSNPSFLHLLELAPSSIICSDSLKFYDIKNAGLISKNTMLLDVEDTVDTILSSDPNLILS